MSDRERVLTKMIPPTIWGKAAEEPVWTNIAYDNGWETVGLLGAPTLAISWQGTIDLSGYARDYKTFYPSGGVIQQGSYTSCVGGSGLLMITAVSSTPLDPSNVLGQMIYGTGPGFLNHGAYAALGIGSDQQDWSTITFCQTEALVPNANLQPNEYGILQSMDIQQSGSMQPTAAQVLYITKVVYPIGTTQTLLTIPASRIILPGTMDQEPELEYMMRLARSVELANQV